MKYINAILAMFAVAALTFFAFFPTLPAAIVACVVVIVVGFLSYKVNVVENDLYNAYEQACLDLTTQRADFEVQMADLISQCTLLLESHDEEFITRLDAFVDGMNIQIANMNQISAAMSFGKPLQQATRQQFMQGKQNG